MKGEPIRILLVEDNADHAELVRRSLADHRVANRITHLSDGAAALDYLHNRGDYADAEKNPRPHIVLLDLRLPKIDGLEVLRVLKQDQRLAAIPVIILTTSEADADIAQAYGNHANSYLVKPVGFEKLKSMMQDFGFYWLGWNTHPEL
ncbi:MAG TPA: response regulator [Planctomycetota bacterium]|nr:response regulator [Planctomycetota bacterium]